MYGRWKPDQDFAQSLMPLSLLTMSTASNFSGGLRFHHGVSLTGVSEKT